MTKSDHELIKFAAGKLNVEVHVGAAYDEKKIWYEAPTAICAINIHHHNGTPFDLTSPELFLKGLGVLGALELIISGAPISDGWVIEIVKESVGVEYRGIATQNIPLTFWQCWAELEGGKE